MAERRMFTKSITESDAFLEMPLSTQALYLHLNMNADDDGFVGSPKRIVRMINASEDDLRLLLTKRFILGFNSGIVVIKHWKMNNYIRNDRYKETVYQEELKSLQIKDNGSYTELSTNGIPDVNHMVYQMETQVRLGKDSIDKDSIDKEKYKKEKPKTSTKIEPKKTQYAEFVSMTEEEYQKLITNYGEEATKKCIETLDNYKGSSGKKYKSDYRAILTWVVDKIKPQIKNDTAERVKEALYGRR